MVPNIKFYSLYLSEGIKFDEKVRNYETFICCSTIPSFKIILNLKFISIKNIVLQIN